MIKNLTKNFVIIQKNRICKSVLSKALGFMFRLKKPEEALVFTFHNEVRASLHMLFVFFPIDVLFLNKDKIVVDVKKNFKPFTFYSPKAKASYIIELPVKVLRDTGIGDKILFN